MPPVTLWLIVANFAVYFLEILFGDFLIANFALWPPGRHYSPDLHATVGFEFWQILTSAFLHAGLAHIGLNMWGLYLFGGDVEKEMGSRYFAALYFAAVLAASAVQLIVVSATTEGGAYPTLGASGGVFGVLLAFGLLFPRRTILLLIPPIPMPARVFVVLYAVLELTNGVLGTEAGVAHFAHLGGMLGGYLVLRKWRRGARRTELSFG
jgi:membrane associated rhomboid family serine protease